MDDHDVAPNLASVVEKRKHEPILRQHNFKIRSSKRLSDCLRKKLNTAFVGAISKFEKHMGHLWGHGKRVSDCSPDELRMRDVWSVCRTDILNNGNNQIRAVQSELKQYDVCWNRHHLDLTV